MSDIMHLYNVMLCWINVTQSLSLSTHYEAFHFYRCGVRCWQQYRCAVPRNTLGLTYNINGLPLYITCFVRSHYILLRNISRHMNISVNNIWIMSIFVRWKWLCVCFSLVNTNCLFVDMIRTSVIDILVFITNWYDSFYVRVMAQL